MPDHPVSVHPLPPFDYDYYDSPFFRAAAEAATTRSGGHCQKCGRKLPLEAHHWAQGRYPPAKRLTAADLTGLCSECHGEAHQFRFILTAGGSLDEYRVAHSEIVARLLRPVDDGRQVGRAVWFEGQWAAFVTGGWSPPCGNEKFWLFQSSKRAWQLVAVAKVLSGRPGCWLVRKQFLVRPMRVAAVPRGNRAAGTGRDAPSRSVIRRWSDPPDPGGSSLGPRSIAPPPEPAALLQSGDDGQVECTGSGRSGG